ncbi:MAG: restriction endonuclease subunit S, partial [Burkholderiales bacterium]
GRKGAYRGIHFSVEPCFVIDTAFYLEPRTEFDMRWAYYELLTHDINGMDSGSAIPSTSREAFYRLPVRVPVDIAEQRAIAHILGSLDGKIELNWRMNESLEAIARALFKSWFVDFDPVRAKAEGRDPGLPAPLAVFFPDRFQDSELGEIPKDWRIVSVRDEVQLVKGVSYRSEELADSATALVTLKSVNRGGGYRPDGLKPYTGEYEAEQVIVPGELVVAHTDVTQAAEVVGKPALVLADSRFKTLVASLDLSIARPTAGDLSQHFFYLLFRTPDFQAHVYGYTNGTTVLHLSKTGVPSYRFTRPPEPLARAFTAIVRPFFDRIVQNETESRTLAMLRDALLPKLISGELRIPDAERIIRRHL